MANKKRVPGPNLDVIDPNNPPQPFLQTIQFLLNGHLMKHRHWPEGKFLVINQTTEESELSDPAFSVVSPDGSFEPWTFSLGDMNNTFIRYIPKLPEKPVPE